MAYVQVDDITEAPYKQVTPGKMWNNEKQFNCDFRDQGHQTPHVKSGKPPPKPR